MVPKSEPQIHLHCKFGVFHQNSNYDSQSDGQLLDQPVMKELDLLAFEPAEECENGITAAGCAPFKKQKRPPRTISSPI
jgi:hypothetical protein